MAASVHSFELGTIIPVGPVCIPDCTCPGAIQHTSTCARSIAISLYSARENATSNPFVPMYGDTYGVQLHAPRDVTIPRKEGECAFKYGMVMRVISAGKMEFEMITEEIASDDSSSKRGNPAPTVPRLLITMCRRTSGEERRFVRP